MSTDKTVESRPKLRPTREAATRTKANEETTPSPQRQIMVRLDSGYVLLSPKQLAELCIKS